MTLYETVDCAECGGEGYITRSGATGRYSRPCKGCGGEGTVEVEVEATSLEDAHGDTSKG